jgi:D-serine deaminase-like pyridoxal phosphate-dependent protein
MERWYRVNTRDIPSPALLVYPSRIEENVRRMISIAGGPENLRPHVKTHKMSEVVSIMQKFGISKFKCATVAEAEMVARCGGKDILLAMQPVGPNIQRFFSLQQAFPESRFSVLVDDSSVAEQIASIAITSGMNTSVWIDINNGMNRTGMLPGEEALRLYAKITQTPFMTVRGLHVYDGHIHDSSISERMMTCEKDYKPVTALIREITESQGKAPMVVAGGTPTFPIHVNRKNTETSPGTCVLWDSGYEEQYPDLDFMPAAVVLTRIVSKPGKNLLCLDLGHKAIAAEMPHPRVRLPDITVNRFVSHNEEHMVIESADADHWKTGDVLYGIPWHICPTVPRYAFAYVIKNGEVAGEWQVDARDRKITL